MTEKTFEDIMDEENKEIEDRVQEEKRIARIKAYKTDPNYPWDRETEMRLRAHESHGMLKEKYKNSPAIDTEYTDCPFCQKGKNCSKAGFTYLSSGKYQRRKCTACGAVFTLRTEENVYYD